MKTIFKAIAALTISLFVSGVSAKNINSNEIESSYIKCEMNENGKLVPNYFIVVNGTSFKTDSKTFHLINKSKAMNITIALNLDYNDKVIAIQGSAVAEK